MLYPSELYGRIGQILREHGDMEVTRLQDINMGDALISQSSGFMDYGNEDFYVYKTEFVSGNDVTTGKVLGVRKRFVINPFGNGKRNKGRY